MNRSLHMTPRYWRKQHDTPALAVTLSTNHYDTLHWQDAYFDPAKSKTSKEIACGSKECFCGWPSCLCKQGKCYYERRYGGWTTLLLFVCRTNGQNFLDENHLFRSVFCHFAPIIQTGVKHTQHSSTCVAAVALHRPLQALALYIAHKPCILLNLRTQIVVRAPSCPAYPTSPLCTTSRAEQQRGLAVPRRVQLPGQQQPAHGVLFRLRGGRNGADLPAGGGWHPGHGQQCECLPFAGGLQQALSVCLMSDGSLVAQRVVLGQLCTFGFCLVGCSCVLCLLLPYGVLDCR